MKIIKHISMLVLMVVGAQGAWGEDFHLGRSLYCDGDWNTLCLPFSVTAEEMAKTTHPLHGATIKELVRADSKLDDGTLYLSFKETTNINAGTPYIVKWADHFTIRTQEDWDTFYDNVDGGETYEGKTVQLATDNITVKAGTMVGMSSQFKGTFDGGGHTITCDIDNTGTVGDLSYNGTAPFSRIANATIKNLKVTGEVRGGDHCAGLVGLADGTNLIENCEVSANVTCNTTHCGGILGHDQSSTTTISNCLFSGKFIVAATTKVGIFQGWSDDGGIHSIAYCVANVKDPIATGTIDLIWGNGNGGTQNVTDCCTNVSSAWNDNGAYYFNTYSAEDILSHLNNNSNWKVLDDMAVPVMTAINNTIEDPVFEGVTTSDVHNDVEFNNNDNMINNCAFKGIFTSLAINEINRNEILLLSSGNRLGYAKTNRTLSAYSAYFYIPTTAGSRAVRNFVLDFGDEDNTTGIIEVKEVKDNSWYSLDGRRLDRQPMKAGLYINNGRKVIIK